MAILYPPIPPSVIPAIGDWVFNEDEQSTWFKTLELSYQVPIGVSIDEYDAMLVKIVDQANNKSIVSDYRDYLIIDTNSGLNKEKNIVSIPIYKDAEKIYTDKPLVGHIYKIQLAFYNTISKKQSEWSQIAAFKRVLIDPDFPINASQVETNTLAPLFQGSIKFTTESVEWVDKYRFILYDDQGILLEEGDWIQNDAFNESGMTYRFKTVLQHKHNYNLQFDIISNNGYQTSKYVGPIIVTQYDFGTDQNYSILVEEDHEEACNIISVSYKAEDNANKTVESFIITRSDESTDFELWEDFKRVGVQDLVSGNIYELCRDYTIESGVSYKYAFQTIYQDSQGRESRSGRTEDPRPHIIYLQYPYLYHNGKQLKLNFNNKLSTFKHTVLAAKQDSLGGKYPIISRNGNAYYSEFPVTGLISMLMDDNQTFLQHKEKGYYYNDELIIPERHFDGVDLNSNLTPGNIYIERKFRDKVIEFLEDGDYKLYRSPTEGNFIVTLMNISLTPNQQLGRMISEFTSTAYEVGEFNLKNLNNLGIHIIGDFPKELYTIDTFTGQFKTVANENIFTTLFRENASLLNIYEDIEINSLLFLAKETGFTESIVLKQDNKNILIPTIYSYPANIRADSNGEWPNWSVNMNNLIITYTAFGRPKSSKNEYERMTEIKLLPDVQKGHIGNIIADEKGIELVSHITEHDCNPESKIGKIYNNFYDFINLVIELNSGEEISLHFIYSNNITKDIAIKNNNINIYNIPLEGERIDKLIAKSISGASFNIYFTYLAKEETIDVSSLN